jgi:chromate transporter
LEGTVAKLYRKYIMVVNYVKKEGQNNLTIKSLTWRIVLKKKKSGIQFFLQLFWATFTLSAFTFGGGYVIVPLMHEKFVEKYKWIDEEEMLDLVAIAQSAPGPIAVNTSILAGYRLAGIPGALFTIVGTVSPPLIIIAIVFVFYDAFKESSAVSSVLRGMSAGVAAVVVDAVVKMALNVVGEKSVFSTCLMVLSFIGVLFFNIDVKLVLLVCALLGLAYYAWLHFGKRDNSSGGNA